jgi:menaquinone-dependent protoporphyrinogen oxidase
MSGKILVAFTTRYGSTEEVALAVAATLQKSGFSATVQPAATVQTLQGYDAVVLGTALYMGILHHDAVSFLNQHCEALETMPTAFFALGPIYDDQEGWKAARTEAHKELAKFPWFAPLAQELFGGKFDPGKLGFPFKFIPPLRNMPANDSRNWAAIEEWVSGPVVEAFENAHVPA